MCIKTWSTRHAVLLLLASALSGCLLNRVYAFKHQFCDFQHNFRLTVDAEARLLMHHPVLYDSDVVWLIGAPPTRRRYKGGGLDMVYVVEPDTPHPDPRYAIPISLNFQHSGNGYRLREGVIHQNLTSILGPALITTTVEHVCHSAPDLWRRSVEVRLSELDPADLPARRDILEALGPPRLSLAAGRIWKYRYRLQDGGADTDKTYATVWFDNTGSRLERLHIRYLRYELDADFVAQRALLRFYL
jgi:hypothetical protein